jgi:hypothetical protein
LTAGVKRKNYPAEEGPILRQWSLQCSSNNGTPTEPGCSPVTSADAD